MRIRPWLRTWIWLALTVALSPAANATAADAAAARVADATVPTVDYNRDIRPILSNHCYACHGPDHVQRKAGLRLDQKDDVFKPLESGNVPIVPGQLAKSELIARITATDEDVKMPPKEGKPLSPQQVELLKQWVEQGATWKPHWSLVPPERPALPAADEQAKSWIKNPIDNFILARLQREGLKPSPPADKATLIRRVTFDLTGLPATPAEIDAFLADASGDAYEKVVDRLLSSPRYGERMAIDWLDASRYADTHGYHIDSHRDMWHWRDWVIDAFNRNLPFDRFTIYQLAGDLLPDATLEQKIATGFNRNHMINFEGGAIPEEYQVAYIVDRINTTSTVWLGLTMGCAQCHDHKYDPITQKEYYQFFALFHNLPEKGLDGQKGNAEPVLRLPSREQQARLDTLAADIKTAQARLVAPWPEVDQAQPEWEKEVLADKKAEWIVLDPVAFQAKNGTTLTKQADKSLLAGGAAPATDTYTAALVAHAAQLVAPQATAPQAPAPQITGLRLEAIPDPSLPAQGPGRGPHGNALLTEIRLTAAPALNPAGVQPAKFKAAVADFNQENSPVSGAIDDKASTAWGFYPEVGKPHAAVFEMDKPIVVDGAALLNVTLEFQSSVPQHELGRFRLSVTTSADPRGARLPTGKLAEAVRVAAAARTPEQQAQLRDFFRAHVSDAGKQLHEQLAKLQKSQTDLLTSIPNTMVMQEMPQPRDTFVLQRGQYDKPGEKVLPGIPAGLPPLPPGAPANRLGVARWLVSPTQPLTPRVTVNRYWQMYFGTGIVKTAEDFGTQGEWPSHPQLLDWLATEFVGSGWNVKEMQRLIVTSATYRQSSAVTPALIEKDPENRLLARGPRLRLQAEFIRDQALAISGLLNGEIGGASVSPYQPAGLWDEMAYGAAYSAQHYKQSQGKDLYRRTMYTFWKRTIPPPQLSTFDAPDREVCTVRRARTNTPLQALVLMNDPTYVEASRKLAERVINQGGSSPEERIAFAFRLATARRPSGPEMEVLRKAFDSQLADYRHNAEAASKLINVGESKCDPRLDPAELAAWTTIAGAILNLDETITKD